MIGAKNTTKLKVALVHDYLNQYGGAERVLECLAEMFPEAPIYTLFYDKKLLRGRFKDRVIKTSLLNNIFVRRNHRLFIPFFPKAVELLNLGDEYDLIISDSSGFAKGITYTKGFHICYVHSPLRYAWEPENYLETLLPRSIINLSKPILNYLRRWDFEAAQKPDIVIANSNFIADKIDEYYDRRAQVVYPPVDDTGFYVDSAFNNPVTKWTNGDKYFLAYGRILHYKRFDLIIEAFNTLNIPLVIIGRGPHTEKLAKLIRSPKIKLVSEYVSDDDLRKIISGAEALIFPQVEDFGLVAAEAITCGTPVIAYSHGGVKEIVEDGVTGILFKKQHPDSIVKAVVSLKNNKFDRYTIQQRAKKFSRARFKRKLSEIIQRHLTFTY